MLRRMLVRLLVLLVLAGLVWLSFELEPDPPRRPAGARIESVP
jgi:hypothetical protein